jgi:hypothetical protein
MLKTQKYIKVLLAGGHLKYSCEFNEKMVFAVLQNSELEM